MEEGDPSPNFGLTQPHGRGFRQSGSLPPATTIRKVPRPFIADSFVRTRLRTSFAGHLKSCRNIYVIVSTPPILSPVSPAEYLAKEAIATEKSELVDGQVLAMGGGSPRHGHISGQAYSLGHAILRPRGCYAFNSDVKVKTPRGNFFYPDATYACKPEFEDDCLVNPLAVVEVLSPSTENYDRTTKFDAYAEIPSLREIIFVETTMPRVQVYRRDADGWRVMVYHAGQIASIESVELELSLDDLYQGSDSLPG